MKYKCLGCFYMTNWEDDAGQFPICERKYNISFEEAKAECKKPGPCPHYMTLKEAIRYLDGIAEGETI